MTWPFSIGQESKSRTFPVMQLAQYLLILHKIRELRFRLKNQKDLYPIKCD